MVIRITSSISKGDSITHLIGKTFSLMGNTIEHEGDVIPLFEEEYEVIEL